MPVLAEQVITTPDGKSVKTTQTHSVTLRDPQDPFSINTLTTSFSDGASWVYDGTARTVTAKSAEGRETVTTLDVYGRVIKQTLGNGVAPLEYTYDTFGRPKSMKQGTMQTTYAYDARHRIISDTDAANNATGFVYDDADRVTEKRLPGNRVYKYSYDKQRQRGDGDDAARQGPHVHRHQRQPLEVVHAAGLDGRLRPLATRPSAASQNMTLPERRAARHGLRRRRAADVRGRSHVRLRRRAGSLQHDHQRRADDRRTPTTGCCPKSITATAGTYDYTLGDKLLPTAEKLTVGATEITRAVAFDDDRLATKSGPFTLKRTGPAGAVSEITDGKLSLTYAYDANGRPDDAHAEGRDRRALLPEAHVRQRRAGRASARSASTARRTRSTTATTAPASC